MYIYDAKIISGQSVTIENGDPTYKVCISHIIHREREQHKRSKKKQIQKSYFTNF